MIPREHCHNKYFSQKEMLWTVLWWKALKTTGLYMSAAETALVKFTSEVRTPKLSRWNCTLEKHLIKCRWNFCNHCLDQMLSEKMDLNLLNIFRFVIFKMNSWQCLKKTRGPFKASFKNALWNETEIWACSEQMAKGLITVFIFLQMCVLGAS